MTADQLRTVTGAIVDTLNSAFFASHEYAGAEFRGAGDALLHQGQSAALRMLRPLTAGEALHVVDTVLELYGSPQREPDDHVLLWAHIALDEVSRKQLLAHREQYAF